MAVVEGKLHSPHLYDLTAHTRANPDEDMAATVMAGKFHISLVSLILRHKANSLSQVMEVAAISKVVATPVAAAAIRVAAAAMVEVRVSSPTI